MNSSNHTLSIIEFLVFSKEPKRLSEISKHLSINNTTAYRILSSLRDSEWAVKDKVTKKYRYGDRLLQIATSLVSKLDLRNVSLPYLQQVYEKIGEDARLSSRVGLERVYIDQIQSDHELRHFVRVGQRLPLWSGAAGKAILAHMEQNEIEAVIDRFKKSGVRLFASGRTLNIANLRKELTAIRKQGFSLSKGERIAGTIGLAAPIFGQGYKVVGAISTGGPESRFSMKAAIHFGPFICKGAKKISEQLQT